MKENYSLFLTKEINNQLQQDLSGIFYEMFPFDKLSEIKTGSERDRIYNVENTILTMILTMTEEDKSLQNSVNIYSHLHERNRKRIKEIDQRIRDEYQNLNQKRKAGRPRKTIGRIAKSKIDIISRDTSGYSQARIRLPAQALDIVFQSSRDFSGIKYPGTWHGLKVFIADGTYLQMQDTDAIKEKFSCPALKAYPRGLLEVIIEQGSGAVYDFVLESDSKSELELISPMIRNIPKGSLLLADDLYNCFTIFALLKRRGIEIIVPGKRVRNYQIIEYIGSGDEIVEIKKSGNSKWLNGSTIAEKKLTMRRIEYNNPNKEGEKLVLYSSLLDAGISKEEIILKYSSRWDIEISIREMKTIMDINIVRAKSPNTAYKEVITALIAYNYIRRIIAKTTENSDFSPETDIIQKYYENYKQVFVDKLGRKYSKWSPGRRGYTDERNTETQNQ
jgi:hypothetical protein